MITTRTSRLAARKRRAPLVGGALVALVVAGGAADVVAVDGAPPEVAIEGRVQVAATTLTDGAEGEAEVEAAIVTEDGARYELARTDEALELQKLAGQEVAATGVLDGDLLAVEQFRRIGSFWPPHLGAKRAAVIRFKFATTGSNFPSTEENLRNLVFDGPNSLANMWANDSRGKLSLTGDVFTETLPADLPRTCDTTAGYTWLEYFRTLYAGYDFYLLVAPSTGCGNVAGRAEILGNASWYFTAPSERELWHEMGHNLGFGHASSLLSCSIGGTRVSIADTCSASEYGDTTTAMGGGSGACSYTAWNQVVADWGVPWTQVSANGTLQIRARDLGRNDQPQALVVPGAPGIWGGYYLFEWRTADYPSCTSAGQTGVQVRVVPDAQVGERSYLLDATPRDDAPGYFLAPGQTFYDPTSNVAVTLDSQDLTTGVATLSVAFDRAPPPPPPAATVSVAGGVLTVNGDTTDNAFSLRDDAGSVVVTDSRTVTAGTGCATVTATSARCTGATRTIVNADAGNDTVTVESVLPTDVQGGAGDDTLRTGVLPDGRTRFAGGAGLDRADYGARVSALAVTLDGAPNDGAKNEKDDIEKDVEVVVGGAGADKVVGSPADDTLYGGPGNDTLDGRNGADTLDGGDGDDLVKGGPGRDTLDGSNGADELLGGAGTDTHRGGPGTDVLKTKDRVDEIVDCGSGVDEARPDGPPKKPRGELVIGDELAGCESVK